MQNKISTVKIISLPVANLSFSQQVNLICSWAEANKSRVVCCANVHMVVEAHKDKSFQQALKEADLITPDGMPLVWYMRRKTGKRQQRVAGMDLLPVLCQKASEKQLKVFFLGSTKEVLNTIHQRLKTEYPHLPIAGFYAPPFRPMSDQEHEKIVKKINASGAQLVLVSLGCPKQEKWMLAHKGKIQAVMVGVGGAFPVFAGTQRRAPLWMQKIGLEWLYRLIKEPRRLFKRYLTTNFYFIFLIVKDRFRLNKSQTRVDSS